MVVFFDTEIALTYGVNAAILLQSIYGWVRFNKANDKHYHDGRYWTYNSQKALADLFPFVSERTVWTALKKLSDEGLILTGSYNANPYDKTKWYTLTDKGMALMEGKEDISGSQPQNVPNVDAANISASTPQNPCNNTNIETNIDTNNNPPIVPQQGDVRKKSKNDNGLTPEQQEAFNVFYAAYPRHEGKKPAEKAFGKLKLTQGLLDRMLESIEKHKLTRQWQENNGAYVPLPATFINQERWDDEIKPTPSQPTTTLLGESVTRPDSAAAKAALYANLNAQLERMRREDDEKRGIGG